MPVSEVVLRECRECGKTLSKHRSGDSRIKYCSKQCQQKVGNRNYTNKVKAKRIEPLLEATAAELPTRRKGTTYHKLVEKGYAEMIVNGTMTSSHAADLLSVTPAAVSRSMGTYRVEQARLHAEEDWEMDFKIARLFPISELGELADLEVGSDRANGLISDICEAFWSFENRYFTIGSKQLKFVREEFHTEIIIEFVKALAWGKRVLVLTPPRHGKSELVLRFCGWLMIM